jgi:hypothetical protein
MSEEQRHDDEGLGGGGGSSSSTPKVGAAATKPKKTIQENEKVSRSERIERLKNKKSRSGSKQNS